MSDQGGPEYVRACVEACVRMQEEVGLDVLVPGSAERLDMVSH
jgi:methionine synthase II (cobalamin-independent)